MHLHNHPIGNVWCDSRTSCLIKFSAPSVRVRIIASHILILVTKVSGKNTRRMSSKERWVISKKDGRRGRRRKKCCFLHTVCSCAQPWHKRSINIKNRMICHWSVFDVSAEDFFPEPHLQCISWWPCSGTRQTRTFFEVYLTDARNLEYFCQEIARRNYIILRRMLSISILWKSTYF